MNLNQENLLELIRILISFLKSCLPNMITESNPWKSMKDPANSIQILEDLINKSNS